MQFFFVYWACGHHLHNFAYASPCLSPPPCPYPLGKEGGGGSQATSKSPPKAGGTNSAQICTQTCTQTWNGQRVQQFKTLWVRQRMFYTVPVQQ